MKKNIITVTAALLMGYAGAKGQTILSGGGTNTCGAVGGGSNTNTSVGCSSGAGLTTGIDNTLVGDLAGTAITTGTANVAVGYNAGSVLTTGTNCTFVGANSGQNTTGINNTFLGSAAGQTNSTGTGNTMVGTAAGSLGATSNNTFLGFGAGYNCGVDQNVAVGVKALFTLGGSYAWGTVGSNVATGYEALYNTIAQANTALGYKAGYTNTSGTENTFVGYGADANAGTYTDCAAFGYNTVVTASDKMFFGDANVIGCYNSPVAAWFSYSDGRFKNNVKENVKGLAFINKLRPVTYNVDAKKFDEFITQNMSDDVKAKHKAMDFTASTTKVHSGFIAQEVEQAAQQVGFTCSIVDAPSNSSDPYALSYSEIVVPLVKGMQEQQSMIESLEKQVAQLTQLVNAMGGLNNTNDATANRKSVQLTNANAVVLNQNVPNPFAEQTIINYSIPQTASVAQILFYDMAGQLIKTTDITTKGAGQLNVFANDLSNGNYSYTLVIDGKIIDTKKMMKQQ